MGRKHIRKIQTLIVYFILTFFITGIFTPMTYAGDNYTYDAINRLETAALENGQVIAYTYDDLGNIVSVAYTILGPEINLMQGGTDIPVWGSHHFGDVPINTSQTATFTIENLGEQNLILNDFPRVRISGTHAGNFQVTQQAPASIAPDSHATFQIMFSPSSQGYRTAQVSISNNDPDDNENPYTFTISATCINGICSIDSGGNAVVTDPNSIVAPCTGMTYTVEAGENVEFKAGRVIILKPGFWAKAGSNFRAHIDPSLIQ